MSDIFQPNNKKSKLEPPGGAPGSPSRNMSPEALSAAMRSGETELHCEKCNISFKKIETYKVHKENYCESRHANVEAIQAARAEKQREREELKLVNKVSLLVW